MSIFNIERGCGHVLLDTWVVVTVSLWLWTSHHLPDFLFPFPMDKLRGSNELNPRFSSVQSLSCVWLFVTPWTAAHQSSLSITTSQSLLKLMSITSVRASNHLILSSPSPPAWNLSLHQGFFQWVSSLHLVAKVLEFQHQHQSFQWIFRTDFL